MSRNRRWILTTSIITLTLAFTVLHPFLSPLVRRGNVWTQIVVGDLQEGYTQWLGRDVLLRTEAQATIEEMEIEIERLRWLEAESVLRSEHVTPLLATLAEAEADTRRNLDLLTQLAAEGQAVVTESSQSLGGAELQAVVDRKRVEFQARREQLAIYREMQSLYQEATSDAAAARREAYADVDLLRAHLALLDARAMRAQSGDCRRSVHDSGQTSASPQAEIVDLLDALKAERRILEKRQMLEDMKNIAQFGTGPGEDIGVGESYSVSPTHVR